MICPVCDEVLEDGQGFCKLCGSQTIEREETVQEDELNTSKRNQVSSTISEEASSEPSSSVESNELSLNESLNLILRKQVSDLINLGCSEKLKDVVFFMWLKYLQKLEDPFAPMKKEKVIKKPCKHKTYVEQDIDSNSDSDAVVPGNDCLEAEDPSRSEFAANHKNVMAKDELGQKKKDIISQGASANTLSFCYLGLMYTQDRLLLQDFLRLVRDGRILYQRASFCVPYPHAENSGAKWKEIPSANLVVKNCTKLITFLELPKLKKRPVMPIVLRFVKDLNLPDHIIPIVKILADKLEKHATKKIAVYKILTPGITAIALIIVALKLFLVFDGEYEVEHSEVTKKINVLQQDQRLFVWDQWQKQASLKEYLFLTPNDRCNKIPLVDSLCSAHVVSEHKASLPPEALLHHHEMSKRKNLAEALNSLRSGNEAVPERSAPTSFPLTQKLKNFLDGWKNLPMYRETQEIDFSLLTKNFSSDLLFYKSSGSKECVLPKKDSFKEEIIEELLSNCLYKPICFIDGADSNAIQTSSEYWHKAPRRNDRSNWESVWSNDIPPSFHWLIQFMSKYIETDCREVYEEVIRIEKIALNFAVYSNKSCCLSALH